MTDKLTELLDEVEKYGPPTCLCALPTCATCLSEEVSRRLVLASAPLLARVARAMVESGYVGGICEADDACDDKICSALRALVEGAGKQD